MGFPTHLKLNWPPCSLLSLPLHCPMGFAWLRLSLTRSTSLSSCSRLLADTLPSSSRAQLQRLFIFALLRDNALF